MTTIMLAPPGGALSISANGRLYEAATHLSFIDVDDVDVSTLVANGWIAPPPALSGGGSLAYGINYTTDGYTYVLPRATKGQSVLVLAVGGGEGDWQQGDTVNGQQKGFDTVDFLEAPSYTIFICAETGAWQTNAEWY
jgi:hypothetical protein